ncbi:hypothetical protein P7H75_02825 [Vagococcus carniphilus]|uniref:hypothetical protein n=1 Tax=Vagococcus carniphilus TaxID=218144 RepID=UPI002890118B|nr:hypothetical protein [Vagococcus carniphilus]MDT2813765.1 hypothetical protein [Vagococcus carniphilus]
MRVKNKQKIVKYLNNVLLGLLLILIGGFANMYLWNNIISELFDIRTLNFIQAMAVDLVLSYFVYQYRQDERSTKDKCIETLSVTITFLIIGFVLTFFI